MPWIDPTPKERHRPPHQLERGPGLFITASTVNRAPHLLAPKRRTWFAELLHSRAGDCGIRLVA